MKAAILLSFLTLGVTANELPCCEHDACYRNLVDARYAEKASEFCPAFLAGTTTNTVAVPTEFGNCHDVDRVSSACTCVTHGECVGTTTKATASSNLPSTDVRSELTTVEKHTTTDTADQESDELTSEMPFTTSSAPSGSSIVTKTTKWTTSTIYSTSTRTITICSVGDPDCPTELATTVTESIPVSTTTFPVTDGLPASSNISASEQPTSTGATWPIYGSHSSVNGSQSPLVAGDGCRLGLEAAAVLAGVFAAAA
jgi:hypothetical protein